MRKNLFEINQLSQKYFFQIFTNANLAKGCTHGDMNYLRLLFIIQAKGKSTQKGKVNGLCMRIFLS